MSQSGILKVADAILPPDVPTSFVTNSGTAVPAANQLNIIASYIAASSTPVQTIGFGNTVETEVQLSSAAVSSNVANAGLASFNSADFIVDANGFVTFTGTGSTQTLTGNTGGAISPIAGNINTLGSGSITISGSGNTLTTQLVGLSNHAIQIGAGTSTLTQLGPGTTGQVLQTNTSNDPTWSTATYPSTTTINQILYSSAANTVSGLATANNGVLTTGTTGIPVITALSADGQLIIGSGSGIPIAATLTAGNGVQIVNAANSITISATGAAFAYTNVNHAASPYTVLSTDQYISVDCSAGVVSLLFPNVPTARRTWVIKDRTGNSAANNITLTTVGGAVTIDGSTSYVMETNYAALQLLANATPTYEIY